LPDDLNLRPPISTDGPRGGNEDDQDPGPVECFAPRFHDIAGFFIGLALTLVSVLLMVSGHLGDSSLEVALGRVLFGTLSVWAGSISVRWLLRLRNREPRLALTSEGIMDRISLGRPIRIPWEEIKSIEGTSNGTLEIEVEDTSRLGLTLQRRFLAKFLRRSRRAHVVIPVRLLSVPAPEIIDRAMEFHEARLLHEVRGSERLPPGA